ncbi:hypothetical protein J1N10_06035 [Carboxylicivirga sp. A043]|uniref:hypothetical protein n=1 Tax=Carboxylicivirga litoralis TaxID=2816963 RepID=UPI0021CB2850|nr:hypothetical protein [Carboxylicivirga sp. A043]MCU4155527.1 hypothetical protein [Carboxylicivirga sp. A043]
MKNSIVLMMSILLLVACGQKKSSSSENVTVQKTEVIDVAQVLDKAENSIDKEVVFKGWVSHVCKHSGRRCFLKSEDGSVSIRVEAGGQINGFNKELTGSQLRVVGVMKVKKLDEQYLDEWQAKVEAAHKHEDVEEGGEHCSAEMDNINEMREWMKKNGKDYYPIYFVNGTDYSILN